MLTFHGNPGLAVSPIDVVIALIIVALLVGVTLIGYFRERRGEERPRGGEAARSVNETDTYRKAA